MTASPEVCELLDVEPYYTADSGAAYHGDSRELLEELPAESIDLVVTSPPFALNREKEYGNKPSEEYNDWFMEFARRVRPVLKPHGSFVIDIGGGWKKGQPERSLYHFELLTRLAGDAGPFHLAQDCYWYNPAKLPTPAEWVTIRRVRVTDAVNHVWWLAKEVDKSEEKPKPEADNRRVLQDYSESQQKLMEEGYKDKKRPSGHDISDTFDDPQQDGSIPPNLIEAGNTASNTHYLNACKEMDIDPHPARFPRKLPEFFIKFLTPDPPYDDETPVVLDIFGGSNLTGEVASDLGRNWITFEKQEEYLHSSQFRFLTMEELKKIRDDEQTGLNDFGQTSQSEE